MPDSHDAARDDEEPQDAITAEEMTGTALPGQPSIGTDSTQKRDAFAELMAPKPKHHPAPKPSRPRAHPNLFIGRDGLGAYSYDPTAFGPERVIYYNDDFVVINDLYPKAAVHILLLPRDPSKFLLHPFDAFEDREFLALVQKEVKSLRVLVAKELRRRYGKFSATERKREAALEAALAADPRKAELQQPEESLDLPPGRDYSTSVISGIHAHPSMSHLHIHVLSVDAVSDCLHHRSHYNSFKSPFLIDVEDFPLSPTDVRRHPGREGYLQRDLVCWRCGKNFGNKYIRHLKEHLEWEFEEWKKE
ncbi:HIT-like protein [Xylona heveae TC161]|uniref:HIT-like protein n=1 Tax=Xylona heveae (strain CBS 132557 / TC161) TaxID=1328760 RepID=A0A165JRE3_XYLHT|nr:HIT-like protein [Xylona heveae TC161]KZF26540.1 HIT-like protein [Xylona heveae TC161]